MFESEAIGPSVTLTLPLAAVTTVFLRLLGTTIASDDNEARPGGGARSPAPRRWPRPEMFESEAIGPAVRLTLRLAAVTTVFLLFLGTPVAAADDAPPDGGARFPAPRRWPRPEMFESEAIGPAVTLTLRPAAVTTVFLRLLGTPVAAADDARPDSPATRR